MDTKTFELFLSLAATNSFSRTAALLGTTQSSVSKSIAAMERELSTRLFDRTGRGATLSPEGRLLIPRIESLGFCHSKPKRQSGTCLIFAKVCSTARCKRS